MACPYWAGHGSSWNESSGALGDETGLDEAVVDSSDCHGLFGFGRAGMVWVVFYVRVCRSRRMVVCLSFSFRSFSLIRTGLCFGLSACGGGS